ncbi:family 3 glycoside hydrolase [Tricholoma matsutake]|nr:family 3 glycoside hydrolase [Tricholoma matsutake 945]
MVPRNGLFLSSTLVLCLSPLLSFGEDTFGVSNGLHFSLQSCAMNIDGLFQTYKNPQVPIEHRINNLLPCMSLAEKIAQLIQGDMNGWMNLTSPIDDMLTFNKTGLAMMMHLKGGSIWASYTVPYNKFIFGVNVGQQYLMENTMLGIPALIQSEGLHGFTNNGTIFPSPIRLAASFDRALITRISGMIASEAEGLGITHVFVPVLDLSHEKWWEENFGEDPFLTGEMGYTFVTGLQSGRCRNVSLTAIAQMAATCKHFATFWSPQGRLDLHTAYLKPFSRACLGSLSIMTAYSSYDGIPAIANTYILRNEWGHQYWVTTDAGSVDSLITLHGTSKTSIENQSGKMGRGTHTYLTLQDQINKGNVSVKYIDETVKSMLQTKFSLGLFENPYPYNDYLSTIHTPASREVLHAADTGFWCIILLENRQNILPLPTDLKLIALIGPQANQVSFGDYIFFNASLNGLSPLHGFKQYLYNVSSSTKVNFAEGCKLWSNNKSHITTAMNTIKSSDVTIVMVNQTLLWTPGTNATTGEHVNLSSLALVGAQLKLVQAVKAGGKPTIVVFISGKPVAELWIQVNANAIIQQFYPGELGGVALAEVIFGAVNPSGKLPISFPFGDDGTLVFRHQYVLNSLVPLWSFGHGLSYTTFDYLSSSIIGTNQNFNITVTVHNMGSVAGKEVVQVYLTDLVSSVVTPNQELVRFQKVDIPYTVSIKVLASQLAVWTYQNKWVVEPGQFTVKIGTSD